MRDQVEATPAEGDVGIRELLCSGDSPTVEREEREIGLENPGSPCALELLGGKRLGRGFG